MVPNAEMVHPLLGGEPAGRRPHGAADPWGLSPLTAAAGGDRDTAHLVCFPYAGAGASVFRHWATSPELSGSVLAAVQLPGREGRAADPAYRRLPALAEALATALRPHLRRPYVFFGHSMGALLAFEVCRRLRAQGAALPNRLLLSAFRAPHLPNPNIRIHHLPDEVLRTVMIKDGMPPGLLQASDLMAALLPTLRADLEMCDVYQYEDLSPLPVPLTVFGGTEDLRVGEEALQAWDRHTTASFSKIMLPGPHLFLNNPSSGLLGHVRHQLDRAVSEESRGL